MAAMEWQGTTDGTRWMHRALTGAARLVGVRPLYAVMAVAVVPFYIVSHWRAAVAIWHYLRQRQGFGRWQALRRTCLNHYRFGQVIIDRFAMYAGMTFRLERVNNEAFARLCQGDKGFVILSCHVGNYELAGYTLTATEKPYNVVVYGGETPWVMQNRQRLFADHNIRVITVGEGMGHIFEMNSALADGQIVSIPADRTFGSPRTVDCQLLGARARLPLGPFAVATQRGVPALALFVMKESTHRYTVYVRPLQAAAHPKQGDGTQGLAQAFADELEKILRKYPEQWFNYYEFWEK